MVILGGLEVVVGGYFIHRHYKNKNEKKRLAEETDYRRQNTFPGARPQSANPIHPQQPPPPVPQQKYAYYAPTPHPQAQPKIPTTHPYAHPQYPIPPQSSQSYHNPPPAFDPQPIRRQESWASTLSQMPVANGSRPGQEQPHLPPRHDTLPPMHQQHPLQTGGLAPPNHPYSNTGFSHSSPSFEPAPTTPVAHPIHQSHVGGHTVDDNFEAYGPQSPHVHFNVSNSPQPGEREDDPPPPYRP